MSRILHQFCEVFIQNFRQEVRWYETPEEVSNAKMKFFHSSGVKGLFGLIDGTMIPIKGATGEDEPAYICRKGFPAINCQVVVGPDGEFRDAVIRYPGSCHDSYIFNNSSLKRVLEQDLTAGFLFGDSGYALSSIMMTPFPNPSTPAATYFNEVQSKTRSAVERSIGRLKSRWRCLHSSGGALQYEPENCCKIIFTCIILENLCISSGTEDFDDDGSDDDTDDRDHPEVQEVEARQPNQTHLGITKRLEIANFLYANH